MNLTETGAPRAAETSAPAPSRFSGGGWMTLVALLGAGWGALLSYSAFYLTEDRGAPPAIARTTEPAPAPIPEKSPERSASRQDAPPAQAALAPTTAPAPTAIPSPESVVVAAVAAPPAAALDREPSQAPSAALPALALPLPPVVPAAAPRSGALADVPPTEAPASTPPLPAGGAEAAAIPDYVGVWGPNARACGARSLRRGYLPAHLTADGAKAGGTTCSFGDRRRSGLAWVVTASCRDAGHRWSSQVRLLVDGERLLWSSPKGLSTYVRCRRAG